MKTLSIAVLATLICFAGSLEAQIIRKGPGGWSVGGIQLPQQHRSFGPPVQTMPQQTFQQQQTFPPQQTYPAQQTFPQQQVYPPQQTYPQQTQIWQYPQHPVIVTKNQISGINPYTGRYDTHNQQVENTYFDPTRNQSRHNGTEQFVKRPVYDQQGRIIGYEQGHVWRNTFTGVEHKELEVITDNGNGGVHKQDRIGF